MAPSAGEPHVAIDARDLRVGSALTEFPDELFHRLAANTLVDLLVGVKPVTIVVTCELVEEAERLLREAVESLGQVRAA